MDYERFDVVLDGGEYIILNIITYKDNTYLYLINNDENKDDVLVVKVVENDGVVEYVSIENDTEFEYVINKLMVNNKDILEEYVEENGNSDN